MSTLPSSVSCPAYRHGALHTENTGPPVDAVLLCNMADLRPLDATYILTNSAHLYVTFRYEHSVGTPISLYYISGLKFLMTLLSRCLRLAHSVIAVFPRLTIGGWLDLF